MVRSDKAPDIEVDSQRAREALAAARELSKTAEAPWGDGGPSRGRSLGRGKRLGALVAEQLGRIGLDAETVERELAAERAESKRRLGELKADAVAQSGARAETQRHLVDGEVVKLDDLVLSPGDTTTHYVGLDSPVQIYGSDGIDVESTTTEPYRSRAKIRRDHSYYPGSTAISDYNSESITFQYLWQNPEPVYAVVSVSAILAVNGFCTVHAPGGVFTSGSANLSLKPTLNLVQPWTQPISMPPPQIGQSQSVLDMHADTHDFLEGDETLFQLVYRGVVVDYQQEVVPAGQYLIIEVALTIEDSSLYGEISADFATGEFYVMSPFVQLAYVSA